MLRLKNNRNGLRDTNYIVIIVLDYELSNILNRHSSYRRNLLLAAHTVRRGKRAMGLHQLVASNACLALERVDVLCVVAQQSALVLQKLHEVVA